MKTPKTKSSSTINLKSKQTSTVSVGHGRVTRKQTRQRMEQFVSDKRNRNKSAISAAEATVINNQQPNQRTIDNDLVSDNCLKIKLSKSVNRAPVIKPKFQCDQCDKSYAYSSSLKRHKQIHNSGRHLRCSWKGCHYRTRYQTHLARHQTVHTDQKPFQCPECQKSFKTSDSLRHHSRTHELEPRFKCSWNGCHYGSHRNANLKTHQSVHSNERPFQCPECQKSYKTPSCLWQHKQIHSDVRRFRCNYDRCDYASHQQVHLTRHQKSKHQKSLIS